MHVVPPLLRTIQREAAMIAPNRSTASDGTVGDKPHSKRKSDHNPDARGIVHAVDLTHDPRHGFDARSEGELLRQRCATGAERRVKYLVSYDDGLRRDVIASPIQGWVWRRQRPRDHASHLHISIHSGSDVENSTDQMLRPQGAGGPAPSTPVKAHAEGGCSTPEGYYVVSNTGAVYAYGPIYYGGWNGMPRNADICGIAARVVDGHTVGYWLGAYDGGVLTFGNAPFHGSLSGQPLGGYIMNIQATPTGNGYWLFGSDGGVFSFGDAPFQGSPTGFVV